MDGVSGSEHSPWTQQLLQHLDLDINIASVLSRATEGVKSLGLHQTPWYNSSISVESVDANLMCPIARQG
jgi:hypothetical protein|eukprot:3166882-Prymnesium_polylepis.1